MEVFKSENKEEYVGKKYGRLTVIGITKIKNKKGHNETNFVLQCECENKTIITRTASRVKFGATKSCGCLKREAAKRNGKANATHGKSKHRLYVIWRGMKVRCDNEKHHAYHNYGGRGITYDESWKKYENFYNWGISNGYKEGLTLERIDVNKNYEPNNCTWETLEKQQKNRRKNIYFEFDGENKILKDWSRHVNKPTSTILKWYHEGNLEKKLREIKDGIYYENKLLILFKYKDKEQSLRQWSRETGFSEPTIQKWHKNNLLEKKLEAFYSKQIKPSPKSNTPAFITYKGQTKTQNEWCNYFDVSKYTVREWRKKGIVEEKFRHLEEKNKKRE